MVVLRRVRSSERRQVSRVQYGREAAGGWRLPGIPEGRRMRSIVRLQLYTTALRRQRRIVLAPMADRRPICIVSVVVPRHMRTTVTVGMKAYGMMHTDIHITLQPQLWRRHLSW